MRLFERAGIREPFCNFALEDTLLQAQKGGMQ